MCAMSVSVGEEGEYTKYAYIFLANPHQATLDAFVEISDFVGDRLTATLASAKLIGKESEAQEEINRFNNILTAILLRARYQPRLDGPFVIKSHVPVSAGDMIAILKQQFGNGTLDELLAAAKVNLQ